MNLNTRWRLNLWQLAFILLSTSWLLAPHLNHLLSYRTALISQFELPGQPYASVFRFCDIMGGLLLAAVAFYYKDKPGRRGGSLLLGLIAAGMIADPLLSTSCHIN